MNPDFNLVFDMIKKIGHIIEDPNESFPWPSTLVFLDTLRTQRVAIVCSEKKYFGISNLDSWQYFFVRCLSIILPFFVIIQSDFNGTLKYHFEQLLVSVIWMFYFIFSDWKKSKEN